MSAPMRVLNVAEKNDAAKTIAGLMANGAARMRNGYSQYNKIYEFEAQLFGRKCSMIMTSVSGHMMALEFTNAYRGWRSCSPVELFDAPLHKHCPDDYQAIKNTIEREMRTCEKLIIWTDCILLFSLFVCLCLFDTRSWFLIVC